MGTFCWSLFDFRSKSQNWITVMGNKWQIPPAIEIIALGEMVKHGEELPQLTGRNEWQREKNSRGEIKEMRKKD